MELVGNTRLELLVAHSMVRLASHWLGPRFGSIGRSTRCCVDGLEGDSVVPYLPPGEAGCSDGHACWGRHC
jgi:hypothetical protein